MSAARLDAIQTFIVEMHVISMCLHRFNQVQYLQLLNSRKTGFGVRVRANGLRPSDSARALIRSSAGLWPSDAKRQVKVDSDLKADRD